MDTIKIEWFDRGTDRIERESFETLTGALNFAEALRARDPQGEFLVGELIPYIIAGDGYVYELIKL